MERAPWACPSWHTAAAHPSSRPFLSPSLSQNRRCFAPALLFSPSAAASSCSTPAPPWSFGPAGRPAWDAPWRAGPHPVTGRTGGVTDPGPLLGDVTQPGRRWRTRGAAARALGSPGYAHPVLARLSLWRCVCCVRETDCGARAMGPMAQGPSLWLAQCGLYAYWARALSFCSKRCACHGLARAAGFVAG